MKTLDEFVKELVQELVLSQTLFTALDVSSKVKETMPFARHREVRDCVRALFQSEIEPKGYDKATIEVTLVDGSKASALLYHPLVDTWDLDNKYSLQKRTAKSAVNTLQTQAPTTVSVAPATTTTNVVKTVSDDTSSKSLWKKLFDSQPSLFPRNSL